MLRKGFSNCVVIYCSVVQNIHQATTSHNIREKTKKQDFIKVSHKGILVDR